MIVQYLPKSDCMNKETCMNKHKEEMYISKQKSLFSWFLLILLIDILLYYIGKEYKNKVMLLRKDLDISI